MRSRWYLAGAVAGLACLGALLGFGAAPAGDATWTELRWPFPRDAWPTGIAFRCTGAACGGDVEVYIRAKRGLCANCATGVTDDAEVDGVADLDMMSQDFVPLGPGEPVAFAGMRGRGRAYTLQLDRGERRPAVGYVVSKVAQCDLLVVASTGEGATTERASTAVRALLARQSTTQWINQQLDGR